MTGETRGRKAPRILVVTFGPVTRPDHGLAVRARQVVDSLVTLGCRVTVLSTGEPQSIFGDGEVELVILPRPPRWGLSVPLLRALRRLSRDAEFVILESALFLPALVLARVSKPLIWDTNECETLHYSRLPPAASTFVRGAIWRLIEALAVRRAALVVAISPVEAEHWRRLFPRSKRKLAVVPHSLQQSGVSGEVGQATPRTRERPTLLFVGNLLAKHNLAAAQWIVEVLAARLQGRAHVVLAGQGTERLVAQHPQSDVTGFGYIEDLDRLITRADLCLAPLASGAGVKTKVLQYLRSGKTVVGTPVAFEGLEDAPGIVSASLDEFPEVVAMLLDSPREELTHDRGSGSAWVERHFCAAATLEAWGTALARVSESYTCPVADGAGPE